MHAFEKVPYTKQKREIKMIYDFKGLVLTNNVNKLISDC